MFSVFLKIISIFNIYIFLVTLGIPVSAAEINRDVFQEKRISCSLSIEDAFVGSVEKHTLAPMSIAYPDVSVIKIKLDGSNVITSIKTMKSLSDVEQEPTKLEKNLGFIGLAINLFTAAFRLVIGLITFHPTLISDAQHGMVDAFFDLVTIISDRFRSVINRHKLSSKLDDHIENRYNIYAAKRQSAMENLNEIRKQTSEEIVSSFFSYLSKLISTVIKVKFIKAKYDWFSKLHTLSPGRLLTRVDALLSLIVGIVIICNPVSIVHFLFIEGYFFTVNSISSGHLLLSALAVFIAFSGNFLVYKLYSFYGRNNLTLKATAKHHLGDFFTSVFVFFTLLLHICLPQATILIYAFNLLGTIAFIYLLLKIGLSVLKKSFNAFKTHSIKDGLMHYMEIHWEGKGITVNDVLVKDPEDEHSDEQYIYVVLENETNIVSEDLKDDLIRALEDRRILTFNGDRLVKISIKEDAVIEPKPEAVSSLELAQSLEPEMQKGNKLKLFFAKHKGKFMSVFAGLVMGFLLFIPGKVDNVKTDRVADMEQVEDVSSNLYSSDKEIIPSVISEVNDNSLTVEKSDVYNVLADILRDSIYDSSSRFTYVVKKDDSFSKIAQELYGDYRLWPLIYAANNHTNRDPDLIYVGQEIHVPLYAQGKEDVLFDISKSGIMQMQNFIDRNSHSDSVYLIEGMVNDILDDTANVDSLKVFRDTATSKQYSLPEAYRSLLSLLSLVFPMGFLGSKRKKKAISGSKKALISFLTAKLNKTLYQGRINFFNSDVVLLAEQYVKEISLLNESISNIDKEIFLYYFIMEYWFLLTHTQQMRFVQEIFAAEESHAEKLQNIFKAYFKVSSMRDLTRIKTVGFDKRRVLHSVIKNLTSNAFCNSTKRCLNILNSAIPLMRENFIRQKSDLFFVKQRDSKIFSPHKSEMAFRVKMELLLHNGLKINDAVNIADIFSLSALYNRIRFFNRNDMKISLYSFRKISLANVDDYYGESFDLLNLLGFSKQEELYRESANLKLIGQKSSKNRLFFRAA